jgi:hypothetical protein
VSGVDVAHREALAVADSIRQWMFERRMAGSQFSRELSSLSAYLRNLAQAVVFAGDEHEREDLADVGHRLAELADALTQGFEVFAVRTKNGGWNFASDAHTRLERDTFDPARDVGLCPDCFAPLKRRHLQRSAIEGKLVEIVCRECGWFVRSAPHLLKISRSCRTTIRVLSERAGRGFLWVPRRGWTKEEPSR